jgi:hypothetical protein
LWRWYDLDVSLFFLQWLLMGEAMKRLFFDLAILFSITGFFLGLTCVSVIGIGERYGMTITLF